MWARAIINVGCKINIVLCIVRAHGITIQEFCVVVISSALPDIMYQPCEVSDAIVRQRSVHIH